MYLLAEFGVTDIRERRLDSAGVYTDVGFSDPMGEYRYVKNHKISLIKVGPMERKWAWTDLVQITQYEIARVKHAASEIDFSQRAKQLLEGDLEKIRQLDPYVLNSTFRLNGINVL